MMADIDSTVYRARLIPLIAYLASDWDTPAITVKPPLSGQCKFRQCP